jgi:chemotaxis response regulator CheB
MRLEATLGDLKIRTLVCLASETGRKGLLEVLADESDFEVVAVVDDGEEAVASRKRLSPDLLVLDDVSPSHTAEKVAEANRFHAPVPTLIFCEEAGSRKPDTTTPHGRMISYMDIGLLDRDDEFARTHLRGRLHSLASRSSVRRRTQTLRSLEDMVGRIRDEAARAQIPERVTQMSSWPLELIMLVGGPGSEELLRRTFGDVEALPVPVLVVLDEETRRNLAPEERFDAPEDLEFHSTLDSTLLHGASGILLAGEDGCVRIVDSMIEVMGSQPPDVFESIRSMASLGPQGLTVLFSGDDSAFATALGTVANENGLTAVIDPEECLLDGAAKAALRWEVTDLALSPRELGWALGNALSRRA